MIGELVAFLRDRRDQITRRVEVQAPPAWNPTEGYSPGGTVDVDVVDFDALLNAMDEFGAELRAKATSKG